MENLLESNERTLVMFDAVCSGLASCLNLVHSDIKQMTEHRNNLAQIEQQQIQAKLIPPPQLLNAKLDDDDDDVAVEEKNNNIHQTEVKTCKRSHSNIKKCHHHSTKHADDDDDDNDPHHLASLKLLDKRLADSFSHALNLNDLQKSSIAAKQQANQNRTSIFHVLLGKSNNKTSNNNNSSDKKNRQQQDNISNSKTSEPLDNKMIIDDINKQTRLAMQYSKQLESHLFKVEDLRTRYEMHLKMGLVVKSVSRAYLNDSSSNGSPSSLARRHHCSSLVINDSSSMGTTTHSSMSSLNLSSWSSSRSKADKRRSAAAALNQQAVAAAAAAVTTCDSRLSNSCTNHHHHDQQQQQHRNDMFVSTLSLSNNSKQHNKRLNFQKLISPSATTKVQQQQQHETFVMENAPTRRISSQAIEPNCKGHCTYADWNLPETAYTTKNTFLNNSDTLKSKSNINLHASHSSLKGSKSSKKQPQTTASKTTIKEFIENIDKIETEFESYMGSFLLAIEDIQGFARVCHGDVFEVSIKYGDNQKFKTKISVLKDRQKCDNRQSVFKARIADMLAIKAYECKSLGKRVLLGHKLCETRDLFTAQSQLMTISLNQTGSIKLNLIVTWNPLHFAPHSTTALPDTDLTHISLPSASVSSSSMSSVYSVPSINGATTTINIRAQQGHKLNTIALDSQQEHEATMYQTVDPTYGYYLPPPDYHTNELKYREA